MQSQTSFYVGVPIEAVFRHYADPRQRFLAAAPGYVFEADGEILNGGVARLRGPGLKPDWLARVVEYEPPRRVAVRVWSEDRPETAGTWAYELAPEGAGTRVTCNAEHHSGHSSEVVATLLQPFARLMNARWERKEAAAIQERYGRGELQPD